jgi:hypothetical protein
MNGRQFRQGSHGHEDLANLRSEMHEGFASINRRLNHIIQMQLDEHATRIKKLEAAVFSKYFCRPASRSTFCRSISPLERRDLCPDSSGDARLPGPPA